MARMSIDDKVLRDPRITALAKQLGWSRRETLGCLVAEVWSICYDQESPVISPRMIDIAAGHDGFADALLDCELATRDRSGKLRISGAKERIEYLDHKKRAGREGGLKSGESRTKEPKQKPSSGEAHLKQRGSTPQAAGNPPDPVPDPSSVPDPVPDPVPDNPLKNKNSATPSACGPRLELISDSGRRSRPKPTEPTAEERAAALRVLGKLGERNGVRYTGTGEHLRLISSHLRAGVEEIHLRYVVAYCASELGWQDNPDLSPYLRPETLFGQRTLAKYLDPARSWAEKLPGEPMLHVQSGGAA